MESLEDHLFQAVHNGDLNSVSCLLKQGANVNSVCSSGRTPLGTAAEIGNISILQLLLDSLGITEIEKVHKYRKKSKRNRHEKSSSTSESRASNSQESPDSSLANEKNQNIGYYIFIHKDRGILHSPDGTDEISFRKNYTPPCKDEEDGAIASSSAASANSPDGMDLLEWDAEILEKDRCIEGDDDWTGLYQWYADILDKTSSLLSASHPCDVNHQDAYGRCAVHYAAEQGHTDALKVLQRAGCRLDITDSENCTPLHLAVTRGHTDAVIFLLDQGVEVNRKTSDKITALHMAASRGREEIVALLLESGANVDALDSSDRTPLFLAVSRGHPNVIEYLISGGAKVNIEEIHGYTPLSEAVTLKHLNLAMILLSAGAKLTQSDYLLHYAIIHRHHDMARLLISAGAVMNLRDDNGDPPLILAVRTGNFKMIELLLKNGSNVNYPNSLTGSTPLHEAVENIKELDFHLFKRIFDLFKSYNVRLNIKSITGGDTPLLRAIMLTKFRAATLLLKHGACPNSQCNPFVDALLLARKHRSMELVQSLIYSGYNLNSIPTLISPNDFALLDIENSISDWLRYMKFNPLRLVDMCRITIRNRLGEQIVQRINTATIPPCIKRFLFLEDVGFNV